MANSKATNLTSGTGKSISGTAIASENWQLTVTHTEEEGDTEYQVTPVTGEASWRANKYVQEAVDGGETKVDEVVGKVIKTSQSYIIAIKLGVVIL